VAGLDHLGEEGPRPLVVPQLDEHPAELRGGPWPLVLAHALLLLGDLDRARAGLEHVLTFDAARDGHKDLYAIGQTHLLLARVHAAQGDRSQALAHAEQARRILSAQVPNGESAARAREIAATLAAD
jgi:ATP/maltotriose-dependent transcriptional regulator MalT